MKLNLKTKVTGDYKEVYKAFDKKLFEYLLPPGGVLKLLRFDGSKKGDEVHLLFQFPIKSQWVSKIIEDKELDGCCYFTDQGEKLPFGLKFWNHRHLVWQGVEGGVAIIEDDMEYKTAFILLDILMFPLMYLLFLPRKYQYKKYFMSA